MAAAQRAGSEQGAGDDACGDGCDGGGVEIRDGVQVGEASLNRAHRFPLVGLEGENVVAPGFVDVRGDVRMGGDGVDAHEGALELE